MRTIEPMPPGCTGCFCDDKLRCSTDLGECIIRSTDAAGTLEIVRADPVIAVAGYLLWDWHEVTPPNITLQCNGNASHLTDVIRIEATDRRVIYRITGWRDVAGQDVYTARWPD